MPPRSFVMQQLMNQMEGTPSDSTGSFRNVQRDELFPGVISRDFARSRAADPTVSKYDSMNGGNPVMDLAQMMYQGGVGDTRGTGGMPDSGSDLDNYTPLANPPMETGSFRRVPKQVFDPYLEQMNSGQGMPGANRNDIPFYNAENIVEQSMPNMQIRGIDPKFNEIKTVPDYNYPDDSYNININPIETSGSFKPVPTLMNENSFEDNYGTEKAFEASLPGVNRMQNRAEMEMALNEGAPPMDIRRGSELSPYAEDLPQNIIREQTQELPVPKEMQPGMMYKAGETASGIADKTGEIAGKTAKTAGFLGRGLAKMGGSALNSLLYGNTDKGLFDNLNQTLYGGEKSFRENMFDLPPAQNNTAETGSMRDIVKTHIGSNKSGKPVAGNKGGFKGAFAAARKGNKKTFMYKGKKYTTALASDKKKAKSDKGGNVSDFMEQILGKKNNDPSALEGSFKRVKPKRPGGISYYGGRY